MQEEKYLALSPSVGNRPYRPKCALRRALPEAITTSTERTGTDRLWAMSTGDMDRR
jgi:hypothetical protein